MTRYLTSMLKLTRVTVETSPMGPWGMTLMPTMNLTTPQLGIMKSSGAGRSPARFRAARKK
uniref:Alternative protein NCAPH n=1 Tax=Homo sapiens TaxID=9606 RepID=L8E8P0_HUMAN|nr:alternative protein NCAPH [Homo sapiens]